MQRFKLRLKKPMLQISSIAHFFVMILLSSSFVLSSCTKKDDGKDNTLRVSLNSNIKGLDPANAGDVYVNDVLSQIMEPLFRYHYLKRPLELIPAIAESMATVSKDGLTHTIKIRSGVKFQDDPAFPEGKGRELVADDFVYAWKRIADPAMKSDAFWIFDGKIKGLNEWRDKMEKKEATYDTPVEGFSTPDKYTIVIKLTRPYYQLYYVLAMVYTAPMAKEVVTKYGQETLNHPIGTGPFMLKEWIRNSKVVLVRNPNFRGETYPSEGAPGDAEKGLLADAGKPIPFVDKIEIHEIVEDQPRWLNFMKGNLDYSGIPKDNFDSAVQNDQVTDELKKKGISLTITSEPDVTYTAFNNEDSLLGKNLNLRKAIAHALNEEVSIRTFYNGRALDAQSIIGPEIDGYDPTFKNENKKYDVSLAKEFLKKAGFPEGKGLPEINYEIASSSTSRQMAEAVAQDLAKIGIKINIVSSTWPQFTTKIKEKKAQMWGIAWLGDYPDAENFLQLLYGPNTSPGPNGSNFKNKKFDELYERAAKLPPSKERTKLYMEMRDISVNEMPIIPGVHRLGYYLTHSWVGNFKRHVMIPEYLKYVRIDTAKRAEMKAKL